MAPIPPSRKWTRTHDRLREVGFVPLTASAVLGTLLGGLLQEPCARLWRAILAHVTPWLEGGAAPRYVWVAPYFLGSAVLVSYLLRWRRKRRQCDAMIGSENGDQYDRARLDVEPPLYPRHGRAAQ